MLSTERVHEIFLHISAEAAEWNVSTRGRWAAGRRRRTSSSGRNKRTNRVYNKVRKIFFTLTKNFRLKI